jgi:uncharacterized protein YueI
MIHFKIKEEIYDIPLVVIVGSWQDKCDYLQNKYNIEQGNKQYANEKLILSGVVKPSYCWIYTLLAKKCKSQCKGCNFKEKESKQ